MKIPKLGAAIGAGIAAIVIFLVFSFIVEIPTEKYAISVNPIIIKGSMDTETHVEIKNIGIDTLTNVRVDYGGTAKPDVLPSLDPGEKVDLSPPPGSDLTSVRVTADQGIDVTEPYNEPANAPFVGNNGFGG
ncbi:MAG: hypothetical protein KGI33_11355 [Thaumarchaeota archaeon]|nr:hypothetical protein [Nitrososphaerota archaeon]